MSPLSPPPQLSPRAQAIIDSINAVTLTGRNLTYPDTTGTTTAEGRALQWLIDADLETPSFDVLALHQRYALTTLWFQPPPNGNDDGAFDDPVRTWATNAKECAWQYVVCDGTGRVISLQLQNRNGRGRLPADLGLLTALTTLQLSQNQWTGTIPPTLASLTSLHDLLLSWNRLTGSIPSELASLTALRQLLLDRNQLTGTIPSSLAALMPTLTRTHLYTNMLLGTVPFCANSTNGGNGSNATTTIPSSSSLLTDLVVDCDQVSCPCCTACCPFRREDAFGTTIPAYSACVV
jgi:hypothetical protein